MSANSSPIANRNGEVQIDDRTVRKAGSQFQGSFDVEYERLVDGAIDEGADN